MQDNSFRPKGVLKNPHFQTFASSLPFRQRFLKVRYSNLFASDKLIFVTTREEVNLSGIINQHTPRGKQLAILLHGWEGSSDSNYMVSMAGYLFAQGFDVFRLNFRDHGDNHGLNKELFNSTMIEEVVDAIYEIQSKFAYCKTYLCGFSLGGNFALRATARQDNWLHPPVATVAVCPVIDPQVASRALATGHQIYQNYFVKKWKKSLLKKLVYFPHYDYRSKLKKLRSLDEMNEYLIPRFTKFANVETYFENYTLSQLLLDKIKSPTLIVSTEDDPVIPVSGPLSISPTEHLSVEIQRYGAHCAFIQNPRLHSWIDPRVYTFFTHTDAANWK